MWHGLRYRMYTREVAGQGAMLHLVFAWLLLTSCETKCDEKELTGLHFAVRLKNKRVDQTSNAAFVEDCERVTVLEQCLWFVEPAHAVGRAHLDHRARLEGGAAGEKGDGALDGKDPVGRIAALHDFAV